LARHVLGIAIALLQAVTQIQEVTLTFVPKILAVCGHAATAHFAASQIYTFTELIFQRIAQGF
jgi:flagellar biosynthetic protein FliQ